MEQQLILSLNQQEVLRYLGYRNQALSDRLLQLIDQCIQHTIQIITPKYRYKRFPIQTTSEGILVGETQLTLFGKDIKRHLEHCHEVFLLCVTIGGEIDRLIRQKMICAPDEGVIYNSCATTAVEQLADLVEQEILIKCKPKCITSRFSAGYGDFPLSIQTELLKQLDTPKRIGVSLTKNLMMLPEKSVSAVIGVTTIDTTKQDDNYKMKNQCHSCPNRQTCTFVKHPCSTVSC